MDDPNLLVVVISCHKHKDKWPAILTKGIQNLIIITGGDTLQRDGQLLHLNCSDTYDGLPEKIICMVEYIVKSEEFKDITHILKIDDNDAFFTQQNIYTILGLEELKTHDYIAQQLNTANNPKIDLVRRYHISKVQKGSYWYHKPYDGEFTDWADGGCSYILSRDAMTFMTYVYKSTDLDCIRRHEILEDVMVAKILRTFNIFPKQIDYGINIRLEISRT